jgi:uncharacterized repeat protein (TIGR04076 family)
MSPKIDGVAERRRFLTRCGLGSFALGAALSQHRALRAEDARPNASRSDQEKRIGCKITVLKRTLNQEYLDQFRNGVGKACPIFKEGQEFVLSAPWESPQGFCDWAWADIRSYILATTYGRPEAFPPPFGKPEGVFVACCSDGFRPVFFKIERIEG